MANMAEQEAAAVEAFMDAIEPHVLADHRVQWGDEPAETSWRAHRDEKPDEWDRMLRIMLPGIRAVLGPKKCQDCNGTGWCGGEQPRDAAGECVGDLGDACEVCCGRGTAVPDTVAIEGDQIVIRVPIDAIPNAASLAFERHWGLDENKISVTDAAVFAGELVSTLRAEKENGDTMVSDMLDQAVIRAADGGAEGLRA